MPNVPGPGDTPLERQLVSILRTNREDSFATQRKRGTILMKLARTLHERYGLQKWENLGQKHVATIIDQWKAEDQGRRSIDEKLTHFRWLVGKIGKQNLIPKSNRDLGIEAGPRCTRAGKGITDDAFAQALSTVQDERIRAMMFLARQFGLRFKEAALLRPHRDTDGTRLWIKRGTKGGRPRYVQIRNAEQLKALKEAQRLTSKDGALIPKEYRTFEEWRQYVYRQLRAAGIGRETDRSFHDIRRAYLAERMRILRSAGIERVRAAETVAREAGHGRLDILDWYIESDEKADEPGDDDDAPAASDVA